MTGSMVRVLADGTSAPGTRSVTINTAALAPGIYLLRLDTRDGSETRKLIRQ